MTAVLDRVGRMDPARSGHCFEMTDHRPHGIPPSQLADDDLRREVAHLHETRHDTLLSGSESALQTHTERMLALEQEFMRRFPAEAAPDPLRTRAGSRAAEGRGAEGRGTEGRGTAGHAEPHHPR